MVQEIAGYESELQQLDDRALKKRSLSLRFRAKSGEPLVRLLPEGFALVREAASRVLQMRHFDVQILGGIALFHGRIAEMDTGEGKTLTATLPMYLHALVGKGDASGHGQRLSGGPRRPGDGADLRDAGADGGRDPDARSAGPAAAAYACDITYGTAKEFGFDFLRDRLLLRRMGRTNDDFLGDGSSQRWDDSGEQPVQRGPISRWWTRPTAF